MINAITLPYEYFPDPDQGRPLFNAKIFVGEPDTDPEIPINQKPVQLRLENGTVVPIGQPVRTGDGGVILFNGAPAQLLVDGNFSLKVLSNKGVQKYFVADYEGSVNTPFDLIKFYQTSDTTDLTDGRTKLVLVDPPSLEPKDYFVTFNNAIKEPDTEYSITLAGEMVFSPAVEVDVDSIIVRAAIYGQGTGQATIDKLATARIGGSFKDDELAPLAAGLDVETVRSAFHEASNLSVNFVGDEGVITDVPASFPDDGKLEINAITQQVRRLTPAVENEMFVEAMEFGAGNDPRVMIQAAIDYIERRGKRTLLKFGRESYQLQSIYDGTLPTVMAGKRIGILIKQADIVWIEGNGCTISLNPAVPALAGIDDVLAIGDDASDQAFCNIKNIRIMGGTWADINDEPMFNLRADYNVMKYSILDNVVCRNARETNIKLCGFVIHLSDCDARLASNTANFQIVTQAVDGSTGSRTGYSFENCTADFAGKWGYYITGTSGHTYLHLDNCTSDHAGRDRSNNMILANAPVAASYFLDAVFGCDLTNCGSEFSTRFARLNGPRGVSLTGCYANANGSTDGFTVVQGQIYSIGRTEQCEITGYRQNGVVFTNKYLILDEASISFSNNSLILDDSIPDSQIDVINPSLAQTSAPALIQRISDLYSASFRNPTGSSVLYGNPLIGANPYPSGFTYNRRDFFKFNTDGTPGNASHNLLELVDNTRQGAVTFTVIVSVSKSLAGVPTSGAYLVGTTSVNAGTFVITQLDPLIGVLYPSLDLNWNGNVLRIENNEQFCYLDVEVIASSRPEAESMDFDWVDTTT